MTVLLFVTCSMMLAPSTYRRTSTFRTFRLASEPYHACGLPWLVYRYVSRSLSSSYKLVFQSSKRNISTCWVLLAYSASHRSDPSDPDVFVNWLCVEGLWRSCSPTKAFIHLWVGAALAQLTRLANTYSGHWHIGIRAWAIAGFISSMC